MDNCAAIIGPKGPKSHTQVTSVSGLRLGALLGSRRIMAVDQPGQPAPSDAAPMPTPEPRARRIGDYVLQRELGRGGMGAVYLAVSEKDGSRVAMKELLITAAADPIAVTRFLQEGEVMSRMDHPNIVHVKDIIEGETGHYLALEFVEGGSLRDIAKGTPLPTPQAFAVMHGLLQALDYAHQHAIVHRDVKPENVMLSNIGEVKVADFGIARLTDDSATSTATKTGTTVGTPQYMSPEQVTTSKVDGRSDLYSAGIVCYEVFCGRPPFEATAADGPFTLFAKHVQAPPPPPTVIRPGLDPALEKIILKSLAKRPDDRYQTGAEFDRELVQIANRLCGPDWAKSLEPGADLSKMVPTAATTMGTAPLLHTAGLPTLPTQSGLQVGAPGYAPKPPTRGGAAKPAGAGTKILLLAGIAAVVLVVAILAVIAVTGRQDVTKAPPPVPTSAPSAVAGPCDFLKVGVTPAAGAGGSCGLVLGAASLSIPFSGQSSLPSDLTADAVDATDTASGPGKVSVGGGVASLTSPSKGVGVDIRTARFSAADIVAIADFTPTAATDANLGYGLRCTPADCVLVYVSPVGKVYIGERTNGAKTVNQLSSDDAVVTVNAVNRLTVAIKGNQLTAWVNGTLVRSLQTSVTSPGNVSFFNVDQDGSKASVVNVSNLYFLQPQ